MKSSMNTANKLTTLRIVLVPFFIFCLYRGTTTARWIAFALFVIAAITDFIDGYIARNYDQVTDLGKLLDPVADKILVVSALIVLVDLGEIAGWIVIIIVARDFFINVLRMLAASKGVVLAAGQWGKAKTTVQMLAIVLFLANNYPASLLNIPLASILLYVATVLTVISGVEYYVKNWEKLEL